MEISASGSGEGPGWETAPGYSTAGLRTSDKEGTVKSRGEGGKSVGFPHVVAKAFEALRAKFR